MDVLSDIVLVTLPLIFCPSLSYLSYLSYLSLCRRPANGRGDGPRLDVDAREVEVLDAVAVAGAWQLKHAEVPVLAVGAGGGGDRSDDLLEGVGALRVPEADAVGAEVDLVGDIVPHVGQPLGLPLALLAGHPLQVGVAGALLAADPAVLELGEVALEEANLVLAVDARRVLVAAQNREVIEHLAAGNGGLGLRDQLDAAHGLAVPEGRRVEREARTLLADRVVWVLDNISGPGMEYAVYHQEDAP